jgi:MarR family transcriptional regulator, transcriptional regulator for hemolysin
MIRSYGVGVTLDPLTGMPLGRSIGRTHKLVRAWGDRELAPVGATVTEWIVLFHIAMAPAPGASQTEIARFSEMGGPALVRHIDRLEADGIVTRTRDAADRRVIRLALTAAGRKRLEQLRVIMARCDEQMRAVLPDGEAEAMQRSLDRLFEFVVGELQEDVPPEGFPFPVGPPPGGRQPMLTPPKRSKR